MQLNQPYYIEPRRGDAHISLDGEWEFGFLDKPADEPNADMFAHRTTLPRSVYHSMHEAGLLPDPYVGCNSKLYRSMSQKVWMYRKKFTLDRPDFRGNAYLCFDGVSYFCRVWVNGTLCGDHEGMFGGPVIDVAPLLRFGGENEIIVEARAALQGGVPYSGSNTERQNVQITPWNIVHDSWTSNGDFVVIGIWNRVRLELLPFTHLSRPFLTTVSADDTVARLRLEAEISDKSVTELRPYPWYKDGYKYTFAYEYGEAWKDGPESVNLSLTVAEKNSGAPVYTDTWTEQMPDPAGTRIPEEQRHCLFTRREFDLPNPRLWYPHGMGEQFLYTVTLQVSAGGTLLDEQVFDYGIRTVTASPTAGHKFSPRWNDFRLSVNGRPFFIKGMNWMPIDFLYSIDPAEYRWTLMLVKKAGIQLLRVWSGGGMPETDEFYRLCDEMGILVWQDHFPANTDCTATWPQDVLEAQEAYNLYRIRNHPSLAVHCGGNEFNPYAHDNAAAMWVISRVIEMLDPGRIFYHASPVGGSAHAYRDMDPAWFRRMFSELPLMAESGIHCFPSYATLCRLLRPEETVGVMTNPADKAFRQNYPDLLNHFTEYRPDRVPRMLSRTTHIGNIEKFTLADMCEATQMQSSAFYTHLIGAMRDNYPVCAGIMPWVFRRPWSTVGVQTVDGSGQPLFPYYAVKTAYAPLTADVQLPYTVIAPGEPLPLTAKLHNDSGTDLTGATWTVTVYAPDLSVAYTRTQSVDEPGDFGVFTPDERFTHHAFLVEVTAQKGGVRLFTRAYPVHCTRMFADPKVLADYRENPKENPWFADGPYLKEDIANAPHTTLTARRLGAEERDGYTAVTVEICNTGTVPVYPVTVNSADGTRHVADDNVFLLHPGESRTLTVTAEKNIKVTATAWNANTVTV